MRVWKHSIIHSIYVTSLYTCDSDSSVPVYGLVLVSSIPVGDQTFPDLKDKSSEVSEAIYIHEWKQSACLSITDNISDWYQWSMCLLVMKISNSMMVKLNGKTKGILSIFRPNGRTKTPVFLCPLSTYTYMYTAIRRSEQQRNLCGPSLPHIMETSSLEHECTPFWLGLDVAGWGNGLEMNVKVT